MKNYVFNLLLCGAFVFCEPMSQAQDFEEWFGSNFMLEDELDSRRRYCLDLEGYASTVDLSAPAIVHSCKAGFWKDGTWRVNYPERGQIYLPEYELCLSAESSTVGSSLLLGRCTDSELDRFSFLEDGKVQLVSNSAESLCLAVGETSRPTGNNLRRETQMVSCENTNEELTAWILPAEDTVYPNIEFTPASLLPVEEGARGAPPAANIFRGACAPCHGPSGGGLASEHSPKISGQEDWYLARQLAGFVRDYRGSSDKEIWARQMNTHMGEFSQAQLDSFVAYVVTLEDIPAPITIEGDIARGEQLYAANCLACHGATAMGNEALGAPRLSGMTDSYMVSQLQKYRAGLRGAHPEDTFGAQMAIFAQVLPDEQALLDVTAYINTLR